MNQVPVREVYNYDNSPDLPLNLNKIKQEPRNNYGSVSLPSPSTLNSAERKSFRSAFEVRQENQNAYNDVASVSFSFNKSSLKESAHPEIHQCNVCSKTFLNVTSLKKHVQTHTQGMPYVCHICKQGFMNEGSLKKHFGVHATGKPYACTICRKGFVNEASLKKHVEVHIGGLPHKCDICQKEYLNKGSLDKHLAVHGSGKPFVCTTCQKSFFNEGNFKKHVKLHQLESRMSC